MDWSSNRRWPASSDSNPADDIRAMKDRVLAEARQPVSGCAVGQHVVNSKAITRPGTYRCGNCGALVDVPYPLCER